MWDGRRQRVGGWQSVGGRARHRLVLCNSCGWCPDTAGIFHTHQTQPPAAAPHVERWPAFGAESSFGVPQQLRLCALLCLCTATAIGKRRRRRQGDGMAACSSQSAAPHGDAIDRGDAAANRSLGLLAGSHAAAAASSSGRPLQPPTALHRRFQIAPGQLAGPLQPPDRAGGNSPSWARPSPTAPASGAGRPAMSAEVEKLRKQLATK